MSVQRAPRWIFCVFLALGVRAGAVEPLPAPNAPSVTRTPTEPRVVLLWPTENRALAEGRPQDYYQPTISKRVISGMFGFVRSNLPEPPPYFERFHEGIDIQPVRRDENGIPLDPVRAAAAGKVAYTNTVASRSNFGLYIILEHVYGPYKAYTTYGHLARISVSPGQEVAAGDPIGILGHTGNVDGRSRAHLHFEFGFLFNDDFDSWFKKYAEPAEGKNIHGCFNGNNLFGVDPARLLMETQEGHPPTLRQVLEREKPLFRVALPATDGLTFWQKQFPFMTEPAPPGVKVESWLVDCNRIGIPLRFRPSVLKVGKPEVVWFDEKVTLQQSFSRGLVEKHQGRRCLTERTGQKWASLLLWRAE
ncbi:MAG: M23 family metallopeptidase [Candidatus Methylacidiphilales bacterium]|nr:M23 family metallopeptidase [Candidatus Methylacidiphilales bacterium]